MKYSIRTILSKFTKTNLYLLRHGVCCDFYRLVCANTADARDQSAVIKYGDRILKKTECNSVAYQTALERVSDVKMRTHRFKEAAKGFQSSLDFYVQHSCDSSSLPRSMEYLSLCLASCYFNLGERKKTIDVIRKAIINGVSPTTFTELLEREELNKLIEQSTPLYGEQRPPS